MMNSFPLNFRPGQSILPVTAALILGLAVNATAQPARNYTQPLTGDKKIAHALNRLGFGPRPGDLERVREMGINRWIETQLFPEKIDDGRVSKKLSVLKTLQLSPGDLMLVEFADKAKLRKQVRANAKQGQATTAMPVMMPKLNPRQQERITEIEKAGILPQTSIQAVGELQLDKITRAVESERQLFEVLVDFWSNHFNLDVKKNSVRVLKVLDDREVIRPNVLGKFRDLLGASAKSPAMLIYLDNATSTAEITAPPMGGQNRWRKGRAAKVAQKKKLGINENYAREIMELHTLGVDGGYTQNDVQEVARCFTGWSVDREGGTFRFRGFAHDNGEKTVLGHKIPAGGGMEDGEKVLDILASHPATAKFIAHKLCVRLIADEPPASVVEKATKTFQDTEGDLQAIVKTIVTSPEFFSEGAYRAKIKSPFEYAVSATRSLGGTILIGDGEVPVERLRLVADGASSVRPNKGKGRPDLSKTMAMHIAGLGQPLYSYQAPTGYSEDSREWVSSGALVSRLNFAVDLTGNKIYNVLATPTSLLKGVDEHDRAMITGRLVDQLLAGDITPGTLSTLQREAPGGKDTPVDRIKLTALILGSPEFQRH